MRISALIFVCVVGLSVSGTTNAQNPRGIEHVAGGLYRVHAGGNYYSAFLVTSEGIIAIDPIDKEAASWLKDELEQRFDLPVKYLIYSHSDVDHASGGEVFADAIVIAHENAKTALIREETPTAIPAITFSDQMTLELGDGKVNLTFLGNGHGDSLVALHFPNERAVLCVDIVWVKRVAYRAVGQSADEPKISIPGWIRGLHVLESIDFDILLTSHGAAGTKADGIEFRQYFEALYQAVAGAIGAGLSLEEAQASIELNEYRHLGMYDEWFKLNIEGVYKLVADE